MEKGVTAPARFDPLAGHHTLKQPRFLTIITPVDLDFGPGGQFRPFADRKVLTGGVSIMQHHPSAGHSVQFTLNFQCHDAERPGHGRAVAFQREGGKAGGARGETHDVPLSAAAAGTGWSRPPPGAPYGARSLPRWKYSGRAS